MAFLESATWAVYAMLQRFAGWFDVCQKSGYWCCVSRLESFTPVWGLND
jgi:hypothetical protein